MQRTLVGYVRALRAAGAAASVAESIDAVRAVEQVGWADRQDLKTALGLALAKSTTDKAIHEQVFERYFADPAPGDGTADSARTDAPAGAPPPGAAADDPALQRLLAMAAGAGGGQGQPDGGDGARQLDMALARAADAAGADDIRFATQVPYYTQRVLDALGIDALLQRLGQLQIALDGDPGGVRDDDPARAALRAERDALDAARIRLRRRARAAVERRFELLGRPATEAFMTEVVVQRPLGRMSPADMARMKAAVQHMARRLATKHGQRRRRKLRGRIDLRRTLRANAGHEGVPFLLKLRHRRRDKPRIVAVCDVSGSVAAHVRLLLLFLYALKGSVTDLRCFAFSDRLREVDQPLENLPFDDAMALILRELGSGSTDYGAALADLQARHGDAIDRRTTVLILGDGRSNRSDPRLDILAEIAARAKRVIWLCPEPPSRWGTGDSEMLRVLPWCSHVAHCASAVDLERAIDEALLAYD